MSAVTPFARAGQPSGLYVQIVKHGVIFALRLYHSNDTIAHQLYSLRNPLHHS